MSTRRGERRPQIRRGVAGQRVVLVAPRADLTGAGMAKLLEQVTAAKWTITSVIEPEDWRTALRMVADGLADVLATTSPEHLPAVQLVHGVGTMLPPSTPERPKVASTPSAPTRAEQASKPQRRTAAKQQRPLPSSTPPQPERVSLLTTPLPFEPIEPTPAPRANAKDRRPTILRGIA